MSKPSITQVHVRKPYETTPRQRLKFSKPTMAKQSFKTECDINTIMRKYQATGLIDHVQKVQGSYGDFSNVQEYQLHLDQVIAAQDAFMELPAQLRKRFNNDPASLLEFLQDANNRDEAVKLGLVEPTPPPQPKGAPAPSGGAGTAPTSDKPAEPAPPIKSP